jgi:uncharacterized membrane protein
VDYTLLRTSFLSADRDRRLSITTTKIQARVVAIPIPRGLWLIFLELTLFRCFGFQFNFDYHLTLLNVLWALGWAMIVLSLLVHPPVSLTAAFGLVMIAGHNLLDSIQSSNVMWSILHSPNFILETQKHSIFVGYPLIPWIGVTAVGYSLGQIYAWTSRRRRTFLLPAGLGLTATFVILRDINFYGDPVRWSTQKSAAFTVLSFLNTNKYPPSLFVPSDDARCRPGSALGR